MLANGLDDFTEEAIGEYAECYGYVHKSEIEQQLKELRAVYFTKLAFLDPDRVYQKGRLEGKIDLIDELIGDD